MNDGLFKASMNKQTKFGEKSKPIVVFFVFGFMTCPATSLNQGTKIKKRPEHKQRPNSFIKNSSRNKETETEEPKIV